TSDILLAEQLSELHIQLKTLLKRHSSLKYQDRFLYEACRRQLIRIFTMGVTGFDTPASLHALDDCISSLESMHDDLSKSHLQINHSILELFKNAIVYVKTNKDFDQFDRLHFLKTYINPIYAGLLKDQNAKHIELPHLTSNLPTAINYSASNIFDTDFLNVDFYGLKVNQLGADELSARLLGETLFLDPALSSDNKRACASCHSPNRAFTDGIPKSTAFGRSGTVERNSPTLINAVFADKYFYDLRA